MRLGLTATLLVGICLALGAPAAQPTDAASGDLLPDIRAIKAKAIRVAWDGPMRQLRFATEVADLQTGPLELQPVADDCDGDGDFDDDRTALQRIFHDDDGNGYFIRGVDVGFRMRSAGCMYYHDIHDHWHFEEFANYRLRMYNGDGSLGPPVRASDKISFCMADVVRVKKSLRGSPRDPYYGSCGSDDISGISVGWADRYEHWFDGQHIDITGLEDGDYCLVMHPDPMNRLEERGEGNNESQRRITLIGDTVDWNPYRRC